MLKKNYKIFDVSLARACNYDCSYCNQRFDIDKPMNDMSDNPRAVYREGKRTGQEWIDGFNNFPFKNE